MGGFSVAWLSLREPYDRAARNVEVADAVAAAFAGASGARVTDLGCGTGRLTQRHPGWFHADAGIGDMSRTRSDGYDDSIQLLGNHDTVGNLVRPRDVIQHSQIAFQYFGVTWLPYAAGKAVDREFADCDAIGVMMWVLIAARYRDILFGQRVHPFYTPSLANIKLEWKMSVV